MMLFSKSDKLQNVFDLILALDNFATRLAAAYTANGCIVESVLTHQKPD